MSRIPQLFRRFISPPTPMTIAADWTPLADVLDALLNGAYGRNVLAGFAIDIDAGSTGDKELTLVCPVVIPNASNLISGFSNTNGGTLVVQFRYFLQVSNAAITVTPKLYDLTAAAAATISGATACSATAEDFSGSAQQQTIVPTLPNATHTFKPLVTIGGTPAAGYTARVIVLHDRYIDLP